MRNLVIAGNWKMNGSQDFASEMRKVLEKSICFQSIEVIVFPPYTAIHQMIGSDSFSVGAQDCYSEKSGAYTGEISAEMLVDAGCKYVLVGHSERRTLFNETDRCINEKLKAALSSGLKVVLCVGETLEQRESGIHESIIEHQLIEGLAGLQKDDIENVIVAYEPVWAIGTGKTASAAQAQAMHKHIRAVLNSRYEDVGENTSILYGGSVKANNIVELLKCEDIDGGLIGGASLDSEEFKVICGLASDSQ